MLLFAIQLKREQDSTLRELKDVSIVKLQTIPLNVKAYSVYNVKISRLYFFLLVESQIPVISLWKFKKKHSLTIMLAPEIHKT